MTPIYEIYEKGGLRILGPTAARPVAAVVIEVNGGLVSLVETFDADEIDGLAAAVLRVRERLRADGGSGANPG